MKRIINIFVFCSLIFIISSCNNSVSDEHITFNKGNYSGTFSVTFKNYKNSSLLTQSGNISILFKDSTYTYLAIADYSSDTTASDSLSDHGRYSLADGVIVMNDISWWLMNPHWMNSLYFEDNYQINKIGNILNIFQDNSFAEWQLNIVYKQ